ncbi:hypothetical protein ETB97_003781 [Aspergillus alliaceus]|uniref:Uncharacterized protein n=1 Tax=Petromyces alliaceus TaxID=209559 RepID=A0A8H6E473_PETAA|nr:hypothetical protein ETB97_003781 [Aspergillus burnettii]
MGDTKTTRYATEVPTGAKTTQQRNGMTETQTTPSWAVWICGAPFISGEVNPYASCLGDPINRLGPTGYWGSWDFFRNLTITEATAVVAAAVAALTAGAGLAIESESVSPPSLVQVSSRIAYNAHWTGQTDKSNSSSPSRPGQQSPNIRRSRLGPGSQTKDSSVSSLTQKLTGTQTWKPIDTSVRMSDAQIQEPEAGLGKEHRTLFTIQLKKRA